MMFVPCLRLSSEKLPRGVHDKQAGFNSTRSSTFQQADPRLSRDKPECGAAYFEREQTRLPHGLLLTGGFESTYRVREKETLMS